jgi:Flp pilus assembly protein TadG
MYQRAMRRDRGSASVELVILAPALLLLVWLGVQFAFWFQGREVALAAAQAGARVARQEANINANWQQNSQQAATNYYNALGTKLLNGVQAAATGSGGAPVAQVQVTVSGTVASVVPGLTLNITETVSGPVECFRPITAGGQQCNG